MESKQTKDINSAIVDGYKRGVCDHEGNTIPKAHRSRNWKGTHFRKISSAYRDNYARAFGHE